MKLLTRSDIVDALGEIEEPVVADMLRIGATAGELAEAKAWLTNNEALINEGRPLPTGRVSRLIELLEAVDEEAPGPAGHRV
jgi:hypothetical protein